MRYPPIGLWARQQSILVPAIRATAVRGDWTGREMQDAVRALESTWWHVKPSFPNCQFQNPSVCEETMNADFRGGAICLERNRSAVGKTKAPLVAGGPQQLTPAAPYSPPLELTAPRW